MSLVFLVVFVQNTSSSSSSLQLSLRERRRRRRSKLAGQISSPYRIIDRRGQRRRRRLHNEESRESVGLLNKIVRIENYGCQPAWPLAPFVRAACPFRRRVCVCVCESDG